MARSVKTNYLYNLLYQITAILLPLITMPYVSRVLSPQGVGTNSLTNANTQYFHVVRNFRYNYVCNKEDCYS